jgi:hypothetical protein
VRLDAMGASSECTASCIKITVVFCASRANTCAA